MDDQLQDCASCLRAQPGTLFAVLDAARDPAVLGLLEGRPETRQSLYEGEQGESLSAFAPHLVQFEPSSGLLDALLSAGWGKSWGVFLAASLPFADIRRQLRRFLMVQFEDGRSAYFRFYDPRVLRTWLPTCQVEESYAFFGPIHRYLMEDEDGGGLLRFDCGGTRAHRTPVALHHVSHP